MSRLVVKRARAPTVPRNYDGYPPYVNVNMELEPFLQTPIFQVSFPDLGTDDLQQLSAYIRATGQIAKRLEYPQHLTNFLMALADSMRAASQKQNNGGFLL